MSVNPLPPGTILLHIGPHKTGTTAIQFAAGTRRERLAAAGITFPGTNTHHSPAAMSIGERGWGWADRGGKEPNPDRWPALVAEVKEAPDKVFVTSEFFGELNAEQIDRTLTDLGRDRVHVVVTLRPLTRILPSSWQQYIKSGATREYLPWLEAMLSDPPNPKITPTFWNRQDHGALVERWVAGAGAEHVTVIVLDDKNHAMLPATFEQLLGLDPGDLDPAPGQRVNRSMTAAECELIRRTNRFVTGQDVGWPNFEQIIRNGAVVRMVENRTPDKSEQRIAMPHWASVRAAELGKQAADRIEATGARVIGDLARLSPDPGPAPTPEEDAAAIAVPDVIDIDVAVEALVGSLSGAIGHGAFLAKEQLKQSRVNKATQLDQKHVGDLAVREATSSELTKVVGRRIGNRVKRVLKRG